MMKKNQQEIGWYTEQTHVVWSYILPRGAIYVKSKYIDHFVLQIDVWI